MAVILPAGFRSAGVAAGIKPSGDLDLGVIVASSTASWAGTFTRNAAAAPCVRWCRAALGSDVQAIVVNSGNANACTGSPGAKAVEATAAAAAQAIGCEPHDVLIASTGTIGIPLPVDRITHALPSAIDALDDDVGSFAHSILTTDRATKISVRAAGDASVVGVAKGAAMLAPNMATMLAFITTDARGPEGGLQPLLDDAVRTSFDRISVDACESTNDSVFLVSSGHVAVDSDILARAVSEVCRDLAEQMVRDAEGGSKLVRIQVTGGTTEDHAVALGRAIASSSLWRAAVNGADPNWGRALAAMGAVDRGLDPAAVTLAIGPETLFDSGEPCGSLDAARKAMAADEFTLSCVVGTGPGAAEILSTDLSADYVALNAGGTT
jgi:glutamate N-acetyltransferase/amino-acid N-acetyltransferase